MRGLQCARGVVWVALLLALLLVSCHRNDDSLIGRWTVEKVNVEFDEAKTTPEMVRQYGEMERDNIIEISNDSVLTFITDGDTLRGRFVLKGTSLYCGETLFGTVEDGVLVTETITLLGKVSVSYKKL